MPRNQIPTQPQLNSISNNAKHKKDDKKYLRNFISHLALF
jgi:hypothetical protein